MRPAFANAIFELAQKDKDLYLLTGDLGFSVFEDFKSTFPKQYLNVGVAEQDMIGIAAGLALSGKKVFAYSIVPFITLRCLEQIRNDVCLQDTNVKLIGVGEGFSYGQLGPTHHSIEDIAVLRSLPNMTIVCPGDPWEVEKTTKAFHKLKGPGYLRIGKKGEPTLHKKNDEFILGRGILMADGDDLTIIACGNMLYEALEVAGELARRKISARVISMHTVKPIDSEIILKSVRKTRAIFTLEEHNKIGGLGSAVSEVLAEAGSSVKFLRLGVDDRFTKMAGDEQFLRSTNGLATSQVVQKILVTIDGKLKGDG